jgi:soluble lytic murein transglycosylase-like protein
MRPVAFLAAAVAALVLSSPAPAVAHSEAEVSVWLDGWQSRVAESPGLTSELVAEFVAFARAHPCEVLEVCTPPAPPRARGSESPLGVEVWRGLVAEFFPADQVDRALRVMWCESKGDPGAVNGRSGAAGLFQHLPKYWDDRAAKAGWAGADIFDPTANVAVAAWLWRWGGWGHWSCR